MAKELIFRGIQQDDVVRLIICRVGTESGHAGRLAAELGDLGISGVKIHATKDLVDWNANGEMLAVEYPNEQGALAADRAWKDSNNAAWKTYISDLQQEILDALAQVEPRQPKETRDIFTTFVANFPKQEEALKTYLSKGKYELIVKEVRPRKGVKPGDPEFPTHLRNLLEDLQKLLDPNATQAPKKDARAILKSELEKAWKVRSTDYIDHLRAIIDKNPTLKGKWREFTSAPTPNQFDPKEWEALANYRTEITEDQLNEINNLLEDINNRPADTEDGEPPEADGDQPADAEVGETDGQVDYETF
jgi:hypothetical protein